MCFEYEIPQTEEQNKTIKKEKKMSQQQSEIEKVEERPIAA
jgi:hypothetical protein